MTAAVTRLRKLSGREDCERAFVIANTLQRLGRLREADLLYRRILAVERDHFGALCGLGSVRSRQGRIDVAMLLFRRAAVAAGPLADAQLSLGRMLRALGHPREAVLFYRAALAFAPDHAEAHLALGDALSMLERRDEAIVHYQRSLLLRPGHVGAQKNLGDALQALGRLEQAVVHYRSALAADPENADAHNSLGNALSVLQRPDEALGHYKRALAIRPGVPGVHVNAGSALRRIGRLLEAAAHYRQAIAIAPDYVEARCHLGDALCALGRSTEAVIHYEKALALRPDFAAAHNGLGNAVRAEGGPAEAIGHYRRALAIIPDYAEAHCNLGRALQMLGRVEEAIAQCETALTHAPQLADAHRHLSAALAEAGRPADARAALEAAIRLAPRRADLHLALAQAAPFASGDPRLAALEALAHDMASLPEEQQLSLHFALGKAFADLAQPERSFRHLVDGNALKRRRVVYGEAAALGLMERMRAVFTADLMREGRGGDPSPIPVFIVGLPRSGATLIEQTLAGHSAVRSAGSHHDLGRIVAGLGGPGAPAFPEMVPMMPDAAFVNIAARYLGGIRAAAPGAKRIIDKTPGSFLLVGLIHLALPNARIIHARRDPVDTCLSCFSTLFVDDQPYSYDLDELGRYYVAYRALIAHWRDVLPPGVMLEVDYEDGVADPDGQARRVVAHCGLDWEDARIPSAQTQRPARGASIHRLRRPVYRTAVGRGRSYGTLLDPLIATLRAGSGRDPGDDDLIA